MCGGLLETSPLAADAATDVCIVGAGIAGLLIADRLRADGRSVIILDAGPAIGGETCRTTAHLVTALDDRYSRLQHLHGGDGARLAAKSHAAAIDHIESLVEGLGVECGFRRVPGFLVVNDEHEHDEPQLLADEFDAARRAGVDIEVARELPPGWPREWRAALRFNRQAEIDPARFLLPLARRMIDRGVRLFTGSAVAAIHTGGAARVETRAGPTVAAAHVVVATNTPINDLVAVHTKQAGYQTYVIGILVPRGTLTPALLWDGRWKNDRSYHYVRLLAQSPGIESDSELLVVGGEDHKTGQDTDGIDHYQRLESWTRLRFPACRHVVFRWSGECMEPVDGLAYIGHNPLDKPNVYIVTGDSGNGMTHAAIAAMLIPDLIAGRPNTWATLYDPARKVGLASVGEYARENLNTVAQYGDWLRRGTARNEDEIPVASGGVISHGVTKLAVYKDEHGRCTHLSAVCPHLGGIVRWNSVEKTWDCPCHASRFDRFGKVIHGPANSSLKPRDEQESK